MMNVCLAILCISLFTVSIITVSNQPVYAEQLVTGTSTGLDYSSILELENERGNDTNIDSVRIWLSENNSFKSFKTEKGWTGKFEVGGKVIVFSPQNSVKPGENVKFGLKTTSKNPIINWKALNSNDQVMQTATAITNQSNKETISEINDPKTIAINDNSAFRFIPEKPAAGSDFRIIGENFIPNENVELYIANQLIKSIQIGADGKFLSTATVPDDIAMERTEFVLVDSGGSEKSISIRVGNNESREMFEDVKILINHASKSVKRGETVNLTGSATPDTTLTITLKTNSGKVLNINTITTGFDGKWTFDNLFPVDLKLGKVMIEVTDGKTNVIRGFDVSSSQLINISSTQTRYEVGDTIIFTGTAIPNAEISLILEDPIGLEIFSKILKVDSSGDITFDVDTSNNFTEGTYVLHSFQGTETAVSVVGIGEQPEQMLIVTSSELNYSVGNPVDLRIQGEPFSSVSIVIIDDSDKTKINDTVDLDENGNHVYFADTEDLGTGTFTVEIRHGNARGLTVFTVGLSTGSGPIEFQTTKDEYSLGDQVLILGRTGNSAVLHVEIVDSSGTMIRTFETFSDKIGTFKIDGFRIPSNADPGKWSVSISSDANTSNYEFSVVGISDGIEVSLAEPNKMYNTGEIIKINGKDAVLGSSVDISITNSNEIEIEKLNIFPKSDGSFYTIWIIPNSLEVGIYKITVTNGDDSDSVTFNVN
jgi:hypothetical protein